MKGRKPKPAEVKRREGNPGKRAIGDPVNVGRRLTDADDDFYDTELDEIDADEIGAEVEPAAAGGAPAWLPPVPETLAMVDELDDDDAASKLWREVCTLLIAANIVTEGDLFAVEQFVMATLEARRAYFELRTGGSTIDTVNPTSTGRASKTTNPAYRVWRDSNATMLKWGEHLGLTPVARARLGLAVGKGRKLAQELEEGLPANPVRRDGDVEGTASEIDPYGGDE